MRQILIERARARDALKRGGGQPRVTFDEGLQAAVPERSFDMVALDAALTRLAELDAGQARIVELRFFGGLSIEETADAIGVSPATVKRHWALARAWLASELESTESSVSTDWDRIGALFDEALALDAAGRERLLAREAASQPRVAAEVRELLRAHEKSGEFLESARVDGGARAARGVARRATHRPSHRAL